MLYVRNCAALVLYVSNFSKCSVKICEFNKIKMCPLFQFVRLQTKEVSHKIIVIIMIITNSVCDILTQN